MWVFPKRMFDIRLHTFNPRTRNFSTFTSQSSCECERYPLTCLKMQSLRIINFCLLRSIIFPHSCVGSIVTEFFGPLLFFVLFLNLCTRTIIIYIFFTKFVDLPLLFVLKILLPFAFLPVVLLSVLNSSLLFQIDSVISIIDLNGSPTSGLTISLWNNHIITFFAFFI